MKAASIKVNPRQMRNALRDYAKVSKRKTIPDILNTKAPFVIKNAMRATPKVMRATITAELGTPSAPSPLAVRIVLARARRKGVKMTRQILTATVKAMIRARLGAVRYVSLGWLKALNEFESVTKKLKPSSIAWRDGKGKKATRFKHEARFLNAAPGAFRGRSALRNAMTKERRSMERYTARKMDRLAQRYRSY
jgi:hypothetical protein